MNPRCDGEGGWYVYDVDPDGIWIICPGCPDCVDGAEEGRDA
jgi:hypothetical protein